jgi:transposase
VTQAAWLTEARLAAFLRRMGDPGRKAAAELLRRLADAPAGLTGPEGDARATVTLGLVAALDTVRAQIGEFEGEVVERLGTHPDAASFTALPRSGRVRAAALLAEIARLPGPVPRRRVADLPGRGGPIDPAVGQAQAGRVPLRR